MFEVSLLQIDSTIGSSNRSDEIALLPKRYAPLKSVGRVPSVRPRRPERTPQQALLVRIGATKGYAHG